jgi:hypothetical protein
MQLMQEPTLLLIEKDVTRYRESRGDGLVQV